MGKTKKSARKNRHQLLQVGLKCFLTDGKGRLLVIRTRGNKHWDLPGGRIEHREFPKPLTEMLQREMREEIGKHAQVKIHEPFTVYKNRAPGKAGILLVGYHCQLCRGKIKLSKEHEEFAWVHRKNFRRYHFHHWHWPVIEKYFKRSPK